MYQSVCVGVCLLLKGSVLRKTTATYIEQQLQAFPFNRFHVSFFLFSIFLQDTSHGTWSRELILGSTFQRCMCTLFPRQILTNLSSCFLTLAHGTSTRKQLRSCDCTVPRFKFKLELE